jgi:hypothetical protein
MGELGQCGPRARLTVTLGRCRRRKEKKKAIENGSAGEYVPRGFWVK